MVPFTLITTLAGGVGAAKFLEGLNKITDEEVRVIVNTCDDIELYGQHISPDIDTVIYTLAGIVDHKKGWGIEGDTFHCLDMISTYCDKPWFMLGDKDLAIQIFRTSLLKKGMKLSEITDIQRRSLGVNFKIIPMTDDRVQTMIRTEKGNMHFQEYFVKGKAQDEVLEIYLEGIENARPASGVIESIFDARAIIVCPSNPIISIGTILSVKGIRDCLIKARGRIVGISPIIAGTPVKGPADKLMKSSNVEVSALGVAKLYSDFLDAFVIDQADISLKQKIESMGIRVVVANTLMKSLEDKIKLVRVTLTAVED